MAPRCSGEKPAIIPSPSANEYGADEYAELAQSCKEKQNRLSLRAASSRCFYMAQILSFLQHWRRGLKPAFASASIRCFGRFPLLWNRAIGAVIGRLIWWSRGNSVTVSLENISKVFPDLTPEQQLTLTKKSVIETAKTALEVPSVWMQPYKRLKKMILAVENLPLFEQATASPRGFLLIAPHLGNWEFLGSYLPQHLDITIIYQPSGVEAMDKLVVEGRCREGVKLAPSNRQGVAMVLAALRAGESVGILPDQVPEREGGAKIASFFGQNAWTMTLVHKLIQRTACSVLTGYAKRVPKGFVFVFQEPDKDIFSADEFESLSGLNRSVENCVRAVPEQYQWEYKRFKRTAKQREAES